MIVDVIVSVRTRRTLLFRALSAFVATTALPVLAADRQRPGLYEFTVTADGKTQASTHCVTPDDAKAVNADAKAGRQYAENAAKGACSLTTYEVKGDTVSYTMACGDSVRASRSTYHGDAFDGDTTYTVTVNGKRMVRVSHIQARRVGACK